MHVVPESEQDAADVSKGPVGGLSHMSLGTQVGSELSHQRDPPQSQSWSTEGDIVLCLNLDPAKPRAELMGQMRAQLSSTQGLAPGGMRVSPLSNDDVVMVGRWIDQVGLENLPLVQPRQVTCSGVRGLFQALQGVKIHLTQSEDDESATSDMEASNSSLPLDHSEMDPLVPNRRDPDLEERDCSSFLMPWTRTTSWDMTRIRIGAWPVTLVSLLEGLATFSPRKWTLQVNSEGESYSDRPMGSQDTRYSPSSLDSDWGEGESETARRHRLYPKINPM